MAKNNFSVPNNNSQLKYLQDYAQFLKEIYAPRTKEETRKLGKNLNWLSFILLILSLEYVKISQVEALGMSFKPTFEEMTIALIWIISTYFLTTYCIDLYGELKSFSSIKMNELSLQLQTENENKQKEVLALMEKSQNLDKIRRDLRKDLKVLEFSPDIKFEPSSEDLEFEEKYYKELEEELKNEQKYRELVKIDGKDEIDAKLIDLSLTLLGKDKIDSFTAQITSAIKLKRIRFLMEVVFPMGLYITSTFFAILSIFYW